MGEGYPVPKTRHRIATEVRRSRFLATLDRAAAPAAARALLAAIRAELPDATHHCWAFVAGPPGSSARMGAGDGGEPRGTAGRPMLQVLLGSGVGEIAAVVSRYFGGVKLGPGGLARAYAGAVKEALAGLEVVRAGARVRLLVTLPHAAVGLCRRLVAAHGGRLLAEEYGVEAVHRVELAAARAGAFADALREAAGGAVRIEPGE